MMKAMHGLHHRLVIEGLEVARAAGQAEEDHRLGPGGVVQRIDHPIAYASGRSVHCPSRQNLRGQQAGEGRPTKIQPTAAQKGPAVNLKWIEHGVILTSVKMV